MDRLHAPRDSYFGLDLIRPGRSRSVAKRGQIKGLDCRMTPSLGTPQLVTADGLTYSPRTIGYESVHCESIAKHPSFMAAFMNSRVQFHHYDPTCVNILAITSRTSRC
jgi:hypothetical protein